MLLRLLALARAPVELAETAVAVGDEGADPQFASASASRQRQHGRAADQCSQLP